MKAVNADTSASTVLVLGGTGFVGRHAAACLVARGCRVLVGSRRPARATDKLGAVNQAMERRLARFETLLEPQPWLRLLDGVDVVVNCVGILRQRGRETYQRVHHLALAALAEACRQRGVRLLHVSALGLDENVRSRFLLSKRDGESALRRSGADWRIVRPSLLDGEGGYGAWWLRHVARWPLLPLPANARGRIAALDVGELGEALATLALKPLAEDADAAEREFDLGGPHSLTVRELVAALRRVHSPRPALCLPIPGLLARLASHVCDLLHLTPFSFGHYELLRHDNCPQHNHLPELLGRLPKAIGAVAGTAAASPVPQPSLITG